MKMNTESKHKDQEEDEADLFLAKLALGAKAATKAGGRITFAVIMQKVIDVVFA